MTLFEEQSYKMYGLVIFFIQVIGAWLIAGLFIVFSDVLASLKSYDV